MRSLTSLDLHFLVRELQQFIGCRLDKVYQGRGKEKGHLLFQFHKSGEGKLLVACRLPSLLYIASQKESFAQLGHFAEYMRRNWSNGRVKSITQWGFERILEILIERKDSGCKLIIEMIPPGNIVAVDEKGKILNLLTPRKTASRVLRGGAVYEPPPSRFDPKAASPEEITAHLFESTKDSIVKSLAVDIGLGGTYAEEVCARARIEKGRSDLSREELSAIATIIKSLFDEKGEANVQEGEAFPFKLHFDTGVKIYKTFSEAIEEVSEDEIPDTPVVKDRAGEVVKKQQSSLEKLEKSAGENQRRAELLYEHYTEVKGLLDEIAEARKDSSWKEIKDRFKDRVEQINEARGEVVVELE